MLVIRVWLARHEWQKGDEEDVGGKWEDDGVAEVGLISVILPYTSDRSTSEGE